MSPSAEAVLADLAAEAAVEAGPAAPTSAELLREVPTPGYFYRIHKGDTLLGIAGRAYKVSSGTQARLDFARRINRHPLNRKFLRPQSASNLFPEGLISFFPRHSCDALALINAATPPGGGCFAVIYIPAREALVHARFGHLIDMPNSLLDARIAAIMRAVPPPLARAVAMEDEPPEGLAILADPSRPPYRFICSLFATGPHPTTPHVSVPWGPASGTLIGHRSILTAAHVVYERFEYEDSSGKKRILVLKANRIIVTPAADSAGKYTLLDNPIEDPLEIMRRQSGPLGMFEARKFYYDPRYETPSDFSHLFDYAVVKSNRSIGGRPWKDGRYGYWNSHKFGNDTVLLPQRPREAYQVTPGAPGQTVYLSGYPTEWAENHGVAQMWGAGPINNDRLDPDRQNFLEAGWERIGYDINSQDGHSGAPVWRNLVSNGRTVRMLTAVHSRRRLDGKGWDYPSAVLLRKPVYDQIVSWMRAP